MAGERKSKDKPAIDHDLIRELARLLDETGLTEIEFERDGQRVRVARQVQAVCSGAAAAPTSAIGCAGPASSGDGAAVDPAKHPGAVTSPMVGTAYVGAGAGRAALRRDRQPGAGGRDAAHHRGDEDHEPDSRPRAPAR